MEHQRQSTEAEMEGLTFVPEISVRARLLQPSTSVEQRTNQWLDISRYRRQSAAESDSAPPVRTSSLSTSSLYDVIALR